jgi:hypothetical protein
MTDDRRSKEIIWTAREHFKTALVRMHVLEQALERALKLGEDKAAHIWYNLDDAATQS